MRVLGICRFSYPAEGGFKRMHDTIEEREAYLYAPERMELRFRHFETLTLPSIAGQSDKRFTFLIVTGENMPKPYWDRLNDLCAPVQQIKILPYPSMKHRLAMQLALQNELADSEEESMQFRLDDDDAVGTNFVRSLLRNARLASRMRSNWENMVIEYSSGYSVRLSAEGIQAQKIQTQFLACGLAVIFRPGATKTIMNYGHHKLHLSMPTFIDPITLMYLRAEEDANDSNPRTKDSKLLALTDKEKAVFQSRFNVSEEHVRQVFSGIPATLGTA